MRVKCWTLNVLLMLTQNIAMSSGGFTAGRIHLRFALKGGDYQQRKILKF